LQADDTIGQMFGYRFDIYMNTSYVCILSSKCNKSLLNICPRVWYSSGPHNENEIIPSTVINIYVLTQTNEALEVVLNALAFIFIDKIDEEAARAAWYDPKKRW
jgi:hypothetical protein